MEITAVEITGWIITTTVAVIGTIKFKLIEELIKKISSDERKAKVYSILLLFGVIVALSALTVNSSKDTKVSENNQEAKDNKEEAESESIQNASVVPKTDLETQVDVAKDILNTSKELVKEIKEKKKQKDDNFRASIGSHWVYSFGNWTEDETIILDLYSKLSGLENIKIFKHKKRYIFIRDAISTKEESNASIDSLRELTGLNVSVIDLNSFLNRKDYQLVEKKEKFGKGSKKKKLPYFEAD